MIIPGFRCRIGVIAIVVEAIRRIHVRGEIRVRELQTVIEDADPHAGSFHSIPSRRHIDVDARSTAAGSRVTQMPLVTSVRGIVGEERIIGDEALRHQAGELRFSTLDLRSESQGTRQGEPIPRTSGRGEEDVAGRKRRPLRRCRSDRGRDRLRVRTRPHFREHARREPAPMRFGLRLPLFIEEEVRPATGRHVWLPSPHAHRLRVGLPPDLLHTSPPARRDHAHFVPRNDEGPDRSTLPKSDRFFVQPRIQRTPASGPNDKRNKHD